MHKVLCTSREPLLLFVSAGVRQARGEEVGRRRGKVWTRGEFMVLFIDYIFSGK